MLGRGFRQFFSAQIVKTGGLILSYMKKDGGNASQNMIGNS
jgi:hypothetical protein